MVLDWEKREGGMDGWREGGREGWREGGMEGGRVRGLEEEGFRCNFCLFLAVAGYLLVYACDFLDTVADVVTACSIHLFRVSFFVRTFS